MYCALLLRIRAASSRALHFAVSACSHVAPHALPLPAPNVTSFAVSGCASSNAAMLLQGISTFCRPLEPMDRCEQLANTPAEGSHISFTLSSMHCVATSFIVAESAVEPAAVSHHVCLEAGCNVTTVHTYRGTRIALCGPCIQGQATNQVTHARSGGSCFFGRSRRRAAATSRICRPYSYVSSQPYTERILHHKCIISIPCSIVTP
jgi:hypothetical protein